MTSRRGYIPERLIVIALVVIVWATLAPLSYRYVAIRMTPHGVPFGIKEHAIALLAPLLVAAVGLCLKAGVDSLQDWLWERTPDKRSRKRK
ncbi:MAG: hypothetical protein ACO1SX_27430 [Actinomycetota bacterium]